MYNERPYCLSLAGFDPCAGAGITADIKTFEQMETYGLGIVTALTYQNENSFEGLRWSNLNEIQQQLLSLKDYPVKAIKIGLIENLDVLQKIIDLLKVHFGDAFIIWDPVLKASTGFNFHEKMELSNRILNKIDLVTPNFEEYIKLKFNKIKLTEKCAILLKGGHRDYERGTDILFLDGEECKIYGEEFKNKHDKHGTGCVFSSAVAAYISKSYNVFDACMRAKKYVEGFILSYEGKLGYHKI